MIHDTLMKGLVGFFLLLGIIFSFLTENETIFPSVLVLGMMYLIGVRSGISTPPESHINGKAAYYAIILFSLIVAATNFVVSVALPSLADFFQMTYLFDGDFVRVTINDVHELAYTTFILLFIECLFYLYYTYASRLFAGREIIGKNKQI